MNRRTILQTVGAAGVAGSALLSGCLSSGASQETGYQWSYGAGGELDTVVDGTVFARERSADLGDERSVSGPAADGEVIALDAESGERQWGYGEIGSMSSYTELAVADGIYFGLYHDTRHGGLHALDLDGEERWTRDVRTGNQRPHVANGVVYVNSIPAGSVRALDTATGETHWTAQTGGRILDITDVVYLESAVLDPDDGSTLWSYDGSARVIADGVAYVVNDYRVAAVAEGEELWRWNFDRTETIDTEIEGIASERLFLLAERGRTEDGRPVFQLDAIDLVTGERDWTSGPLEHPNVEYNPRVGLSDETVYVGTDQLRALDAATGEERWNASLEEGSIQSVSVVEAPVAGDHAIFVHADGRLVSFAPDGEKTWNGSVPEEIRDYLVDESAFVATEEGIYALDHQRDL